MLRPRVIPVVTLKGRQMVKTRGFTDPVYLGDPFNALRIFDTKEVDELVILDISATSDGRSPDPEFVAELASECFMPVAYGGGIRSVECARQVLAAGIEKVVVNSVTLDDVAMVSQLAEAFGSQAVMVSVDVTRRRFGGWRVARTADRPKATHREPVEWVRELESRGAGEVLLTSIDRDGTGSGYDLDLVSRCAQAVGVPLVACGGAGSLGDLRDVLRAGASGAAAGRLFVTHGHHFASLVSYPPPDEVEGLLS